MKVSDLVPWRSRAPRRRREDDPFYAMRRDMNRLFDDFFRGLDLTPFDADDSPSFTPRCNVTESDAAFEATFELPGLSEEDIEVTLTADGLTVTGEKQEEAEEKKKNFYRRERSYGFFKRTIPVPADMVERDKVEAKFDKGILRITMPKLPEAQSVSRRISVKAG